MASVEALRARLRDEVNRADANAWRAASLSLAAWEKLRDDALVRLREDLGLEPNGQPRPSCPVEVRATRSIGGNGYRVDNVQFESAGLLVTANIYSPDVARSGTPKDVDPSVATFDACPPGLIIVHSHHNPKTQGELQDMGMLWARGGCVVLVMDLLGHGERRQHPFRSDQDFPDDFAVGRQDYFFRYNLGMQLALAGRSLMGWMVGDIHRGVDLLLELGVDRNRILLLGSVAGGGDPCAVAAALDRRISAAVPFNFGGPQPETPYPLPADAPSSFNYVGAGDWESTRGLAGTGRGGYLPWLIVAAIAPRPLVYGTLHWSLSSQSLNCRVIVAGYETITDSSDSIISVDAYAGHEFTWDSDRDPVWQRLQHIYRMYGAERNLGSAVGYGAVKLSSDQASHCNNIGELHRSQIHPLFQRWFDIEVEEFSCRLDSSELLCLRRSQENLSPLLLEETVRMGDQCTQRCLDALRSLKLSAHCDALQK